MARVQRLASNGTPVAARPRKLHERVAGQITDLIASSGLQPGDRLPQMNELARMFGVSRTVVREAISALSSRNCVSVVHGRGVFVGRPSTVAVPDPVVFDLLHGAEVRSILEVRLAVEIAAAGLAAERATAEDLVALEAVIAQAADVQPGTAASIEADFAFHQAIARATQNSVFVAVINGLTEALRSQTQAVIVRTTGSQRIQDTYGKVVNAIRNRNPNLAQRAMRDHLSLVERNLEWNEVIHRMQNTNLPLPTGI